MVAQACNPSALEAEEGSEIQGHLVLHSNFEVDLADM